MAGSFRADKFPSAHCWKLSRISTPAFTQVAGRDVHITVEIPVETTCRLLVILSSFPPFLLLLSRGTWAFERAHTGKTSVTMLFFSFFKTLTNHTVIIELKNDIRIRGILKSVDQYLNIKLDDIEVIDLDKYPHLSSVKNIFIRGSVVRYIVLPQEAVDRGLLEDATRREAASQANKAR
ncbi:small nuclear ribonucleoprotein LSM2 [Coccidioides immitis RS]|uniref:Small nuclear ribonucleoprotein LSM2 n=6 Tax=Coccidioides TaxID=5500 RepID=J3KJ52_COCIM|nr:small nuclear ribonucleoprotein LSM2 [Coccidioides immitis RS]EAS36053.3 small nuclear ribonucleoprotein LSM2 [Coccidioides immitis RS]KMP01362.1 G7b alternative form [Coccidioides immitis RMSCC 2394]KMU73584.1 G7b alternative form [Coccidioides immitis RMSCC 3703]KMU83867.1 G7b alternative form [Coccidioides immitis H538.4]